MDDLSILVDNVIVILELYGDAGVEGAAKLKAALDTYSKTCTSLILDLTHTSYISSTTLGMFFYYSKNFENSVIVSPPENSGIATVMEYVNVGSIIPLVNTRSEAYRRLESLTKPQKF